MTINHRAEAEERLRASDYQRQEGDLKGARLEAATALVHATIARDEEHASNLAELNTTINVLRTREQVMRETVAVHIAQSLASKEPVRWEAGRSLAQAVDEVGCNVDQLIDARLSDDGWDPRSAWKAPATAAPTDDPWAADPRVEKDAAFRQTVTEQIIRALLDPNEIRGSEWARRLAWALKDEGIDLTDAIQARITDLTLGRNPSDPPF